MIAQRNILVLLRSDIDPNIGETSNREVMGVFESVELAKQYPFELDMTHVNWYAEFSGNSHDGFVYWRIVRATLYI